jgi:pimeloyl-ACP methyl ester carboxylesterase
VPWLQLGQGAPIFERTRRRFDLVSLDPRGTGSSRPLHCKFDLPDPPAGDDDATLIAYLDDFSQRVASQCLDEDTTFVRSITGENFARDLDRLRRALGERQLSFAVFSNTGPVAASYASLFPKRARAIIIDSPVGPEHRSYWIERRTEQGGSYERALQRVDQICNRKPGCPLEKTGVVSAFDEITARLVAQPVPSPNGEAFTADDFARAFDVLLPREALWMPMVCALAQGLAGDLSPFIGIVASEGEDADDGIVARLCNDYGPRRSAADFLPIVEATGTLHSRFLNQAYLRPDVAMCAAWPAPKPPTIRNVAAQLDVPVLFFHSEFDSDAPFAWSQRLAHALGDDRHIVRYQGGGHGVISRLQPCIRETVDAYLFDLKLPKEGLSCPADVAPPGVDGLTTRLASPGGFGIASEAGRSGIAPR